jgi:DTW domain-containing protein
MAPIGAARRPTTAPAARTPVISLDMPASTLATKRLLCPICLRAQSSCICQWVTPVAPTVEVLILQHPMEVRNAKGTARLLHLSLARSQIVEGEVFAATDLQALLTAQQKQPILLYPESPQDDALGVATPPVLRPDALRDPAQLRLVVLDGTWRKSRKMLYLNPLLQQLPRLALRDMPASRYVVRKAHLPDQLSTLEATCAALAQLEGDAPRYAPLLSAFDGFVAQHMAYRPSRD